MILLVLACAGAHDSAPGKDSAGDSGGDTNGSPPPSGWTATGLDTPESVLPSGDGWLVSEIVGSPSQKDGEGRLTRLTADGSAATTFAEGLDAPKGSALVDGVVWVADIDVVRSFGSDGAAGDVVGVDGATFLNDVAADDDGTLYVSDSNATSGTSLWRVAGDEATPFADAADVRAPNGLAWADGTLYAATGTSVVTVGEAGVETVADVGVSSLDGLAVDGGTIYVSSWTDEAVHACVDGSCSVVADGLPSPADFAEVDGVLVVPLFQEDEVTAVALP